ncbi:immunity 26/phosphotriesterase HocA family protein [Neolewinella maritima]|uniref:immunity 26/phosphotriesterase HocA family protein n=1 Tax=Neolewinella maritima TaxID=1383882 RepID=UPI001EE8A185|nr:immunity 26/phosphotriesterase HocA family protein [Neolewinella maritima]
MKKQHMTTGAVLEIHSGTNYYYAQILASKSCAFFDTQLDEPLENCGILYGSPVAFIVRVYDDVITSGLWQKKCKLPITDSLKDEPLKFIQDNLNPNNLELYNPVTGAITKATKDQCLGLEAAAVWEADHVISRLQDHFADRPNVWVEQLSIK